MQFEFPKNNALSNLLLFFILCALGVIIYVLIVVR